MPDPATDLGAMQGGAGEAAEFLKLLANRNRLLIVCALVGRELSVSDIEHEIGLRQPVLSQQIAELREAGLISGRKQSKSVFYRLADGRVAEFVALLQRHFCPPGQTAATLAAMQTSAGTRGRKETT